MAKTPPGVKEDTIERYLGVHVRARGGIFIKVRAMGGRGFFDRLIIMPGPRIIFCEIKRPRGGRLSPHQQQYAAAFERLGVEVVIIKNWEDIARLLP